MRAHVPRRAALAALALALGLGGALPARPQPRVANEAELKAAFVYRIALFVEWPAESLPAGAPFQICTAGSDPAWAAALGTLEGKKVQGHPVAAPRALTRSDDPRGCQLLFIPERDGRKPPALPGLLTIGEGEAFVAAGGMVGFVREGAQLRFDIHREAATRAQLRLPAELLKVARNVIDVPGVRP